MLKHWSPPTTASLIEALSVEEQVVAFRLLPRDLAADVFEYLPLEAQERLVKAMATEEVAKILNEMAPDDRTALLDELPAAVTRQLLNLLTPQERSIAVSLLGYPEGSIGRLMTPDYVRVRPEWRVEQALEHIRRYGHDSETLSILYVIDDAGRLIGEVPIRKILLAPATARIAELMDHRVVALKAADKQESAVPIFQHEDRVALPVTDSQGMLIGIVTVDDVLDVAESAATRTLQRFGEVATLDLLDVRFQIKAAFRDLHRRLVPTTARRAASNGGRQAFQEDRRRRLERHCTFQHVFELANVAGPVVPHQELHGRPRNGRDRLLHLLGVLGEEVLGQERDVLRARPQWVEWGCSRGGIASSRLESVSGRRRGPWWSTDGVSICSMVLPICMSICGAERTWWRTTNPG
jgi:CBS domain-containing protein